MSGRAIIALISQIASNQSMANLSLSLSFPLSLSLSLFPSLPLSFLLTVTHTYTHTHTHKHTHTEHTSWCFLWSMYVRPLLDSFPIGWMLVRSRRGIRRRISKIKFFFSVQSFGKCKFFLFSSMLHWFLALLPWLFFTGISCWKSKKILK